MGAQQLGKNQRPKVVDYHDYREFLKELFAYLESHQDGFSLRQLARDAQVGVSTLSMVLSAQRGLSRAMFEKLRPFLPLSESDLKHFELLRDMAEAPTPEARARVVGKLQSRRDYRARHPQEFETFNYLTSWYHVAVREMAALPDFQWDPQWIQARLRGKVALDDIAEALKFLECHGFISRGQTGVKQKNLDCMGGVYRIALGAFHKEMLGQVASAIDTVTRDERHILGHTLAIAEKDLARAKTILDEALKKIEALSDSAVKPDTIYHVALGVVPLTKKAGGASDE
jgi:uncharacterized protein (TIGR02147 family)